MILIKVNDMPDFLPSYCKAYSEDEETIAIEEKDWDEYITALRQYTSAYFKLTDKIKRK